MQPTARYATTEFENIRHADVSSTTLVGDMNRALTQMQKDGTYRNLAQRWTL
jgi:ABC-type amino acid transport substrate-binding protein